MFPSQEIEASGTSERGSPRTSPSKFISTCELYEPPLPPLLGALSASTYVPCQEVLALSSLTNQHNDAAERESFPGAVASRKRKAGNKPLRTPELELEGRSEIPQVSAKEGSCDPSCC